MASQDALKRITLWAVIAAIFLLAFLIVKPIAISIIFGLLLAYAFHPVYKSLKPKLGRNISAFLIIIGIILLIALPVVYLAPKVVNQAFEVYLLLQNIDILEPLKNLFPNVINDQVASSVALNIQNIIGKTFSSFMNQFTDILVNLPNLLLQFAVFLFTFYFALRDAEPLKTYFCELSPFSASLEEKFLKEFRGITNAILLGQVLIGIIQGIALGIGLFFLGVSNVVLLTILAVLASIIPVLGSWLVWLPVAVFLLIDGQIFAGVFLALYGAIFVSTLDNFLRPYFLSKSSNLPVVLSVIGTIGGLYFFGISGLVLGPLVLAYVLIILEFYKQGKLNDLFK